jgi:hypothetical protein
MTDISLMAHRLLLLHYDQVSFALTASDLVAIDHDGDSARIAFHKPLRDLADYLPHCSSSEPAVRLIVQIESVRHAFRACARLELVETSLLYRMPRVLRDCGCAPWLRGIALLDSNHDDEGEGLESKRPALWLDLLQLASACDGTTNQKEMA